MIFTDTAVSVAGGFFTIEAIRSIDAAVATPITQPDGETWRSVARDTPRAPSRCLISDCTMPHGVLCEEPRRTPTPYRRPYLQACDRLGRTIR